MVFSGRLRSCGGLAAPATVGRHQFKSGQDLKTPPNQCLAKSRILYAHGRSAAAGGVRLPFPIIALRSCRRRVEGRHLTLGALAGSSRIPVSEDNASPTRSPNWAAGPEAAPASSKLPNIGASVASISGLRQRNCRRRLPGSGHPEAPEEPTPEKAYPCALREVPRLGPVNPCARATPTVARPLAVRTTPKHPHSMGERSQVADHVSTCTGDFYHGEKSMTLDRRATPYGADHQEWVRPSPPAQKVALQERRDRRLACS